jgi:hypothetical protein
MCRSDATFKNMPATTDTPPYRRLLTMNTILSRSIQIPGIRRTAISGDSAAGPRLLSFPESAFPLAADRLVEYLRLCRRGYARMSRQRVVIAGLCRNVAPILPATILRIERLASLFREARVVMYENDSADATKLLMRHWAACNPRVTAVTENLGHPVNPIARCSGRAARMAAYRTLCQQMVLDRYSDFDAVVLLDMDLLGGWSEDGIANTFGHDDWDMVGANGLIFRRSGFKANEVRQYDIWAYRNEMTFQPLTSAAVAKIVPQRGQPLIRVTSCFGGVGVYTMKAFAAGTYDGNDCEHVAFHRSLVERGFSKIFMNPSQIAIYGRRHRSTDPTMRAILRAWATFRGTPMQAWLYPTGCLSEVSASDETSHATCATEDSLAPERRHWAAA